MPAAVDVIGRIGRSPFVNGSPPTTASDANMAGSTAIRMTTSVAASVAPRSTPHASATPGAAKMSAEPCSSRGPSAAAAIGIAPTAQAKHSSSTAILRFGHASALPGGVFRQHGHGAFREAHRDVRPFGEDRAGPGVVAHDLQRLAGAAQQVFDLLAEKRPRGHGRLQRAVGAIGRSDRNRLRTHDEPHRIARPSAPTRTVRASIAVPSAATFALSPATSVTRPATRFTRPTNCATNCDAGRW